MAKHVHRQFPKRPAPRRPLDLVGQCCAINFGMVGVRQHPQRPVTHQLQANLRLGETLTDERIVRSTVRLGGLDDAVQFIAKAHLLTQR